MLPLFVLTFAFQALTAQKLAEQARGVKQQPQPVSVVKTTEKKALTKEMVKAENSKLALQAQAAEKSLSDNPAFNATYTGKEASFETPASITAACLFTGALITGDLTMAQRLNRPGAPGGTCAVPRVFPGTFGTGPYFYDTYTFTNTTGVAACVVVNLTTTDLTNANIQSAAYLGSFNPAALATNYIADPYVSTGTPAPPAGITYSFNLANGATTVIVVFSTNPNTAPSGTASNYTLSIDGLASACTPPPPCTPPTSSVLSQVQMPGATVQLFNEGFTTVVPAGWAFQNNSQPVGVTNWFQGNTAVFPANSAPANSYAGANFNNTTGANTISNWLFAPSVLLKNGDIFTFFTRRVVSTFPDRLQVRMNSTNTGTNVGATSTSVGDFTTLLLDINPTYTTTGYPTAWTQFSVTMSGLPAGGVNGRLAFRYFVENGGPGGANSDYIGIDDAVYSTTTVGPPTTCTGSTTNLKVDITGGNYPSYTVTINAVPGGNFTVTNYVSGSYIPVTPAVTTTYSLVSVVATGNGTCIGTGNSGTPTVTVLPATVTPITIVADPAGPLCAGDPKLLTVTGASGVQTFTSVAPITINASGPATPYPSNLVVTGLPVTGASVRSVTVNGLNHSWSSDVDILLQSPSGQNVVLVSDIGSSGDYINRIYTFDDAAAATMPSTSPPPASGTYKPTNIGAADTWIAPGPGAINQATPTLATFTGDYNGTWKLFVVDDLGGDAGSITGGYSITFVTPPAPAPAGWTFLWSPAAGLSSTTSNPVAASPMTTTTYTVIGTAPGGCQTSAAITITVNQLPAVVNNPRDTTVCATGTATFSVTGTGAGLTYQWQLSTAGAGGPWVNVTNGGVYSGANTSTLTITGVTAAMTGYRYRAVISGTCPPAANSTGAILTVNALPVVTISPASPVCGGVAGINGTALTASGANTYVWSPIAGLYTNATATIPYTGGNAATVYAAPAVNTVYTVTGNATGTGCSNSASITVVYTPPAPTVIPSSVTKCITDAAVQLCVTSSLAPSPFTASYTSGAINVAIPEGAFPAPPATAGVSTIAVPLPATAQITNMRVTMNITHAYVGDVVAVLKAPNGQVFNLDALLNRTNNAGANFVNTVISSAGTTTLDLGVAPFTGTFRADAAGATFTAFGFTLAGGPVGYTPTTTSWNSLYPSPNGNWTLAMYDAGAPDVGNLTSWSIAFDYLYGPPAAGVWSPAAGLFMDAAATIPYVAGTPATCVYTNPTPAGVYPYQVTVTSVGPDAFQSFTNPAPITITNAGSTPYPSNLAVTGLPTTGVSVESVTLTGLSHSWSDDMDIVLQSPTGVNVILMSDVGGASAPNNVTYTFSDAGGAMGTAANPTGTYRPTNLVGTLGVEPDNFPAPGPGSVAQTTPALSMFTGDPNGTWKLFAVDDFAGDDGLLSGGYRINFKYATAGCTSPARTVVVTVNQPAAITAQPVNSTVCTDGVATFTVAATGSTPLTYQWQVSTNGGNTWANVTNGGVYSGATTATLTITAPPVSMSGYFYRVIVQGALPCPSVTSFQRVLTVNPLPTVVISASPYTRLFPGLTTTLSSTVTPAAASSYTWLRNGVAVAGANAATLVVDIDGLGDYTLRVTDINGCTNVSNMVTITDSISGKCFIYPNPTSGKFQVRYFSVANNVLPRTLTIYDAKGDRVFTQYYTIGRPYDRMDVDMRAYGKGLYWVEIGDLNGNRITMCRVVIQ
ncbi:MAG: choice-of-anchor J domain-containing protein [Chitinophagaceae bacterium]|nr:choice-of-anchor J domain-containing protein [Chitinophagaceae bacterium]